MKKKALSFIIAMIMVLSTVVFAASAAGNVYEFTYDGQSYSLNGLGTEEDPILIANADDLYALQWAIYVDTVHFAGKYVEVTDDFTAAPDTILGRKGQSFAGTFDGKGHTITLSLDLGTTVTGTVGLFGQNDGVIKNVIVDGVVKATNYLGGIAGKNFAHGVIENCVNKATISTNYVQDGWVGGICGVNGGTIRNCENYGEIRSDLGDCKGSPSSYGYIAGIVGDNQGIVLDCGNYADITAIKNKMVGGICGHAGSSASESTVINCYNEGAIKGATAVGGIVGTTTQAGYIANCYNKGSVESYNALSYSGSVGGICGTLEGISKDKIGYYPVIDKDGNGGSTELTFDYQGFYLINCYNEGTVTGYNLITGYKQRPVAGGIAGEQIRYSWIKNCYSDAAVTSVGTAVGGVVGQFRPYMDANFYTDPTKEMIENCYWNSSVADVAGVGYLLKYNTKDTYVLSDVIGFEAVTEAENADGSLVDKLNANKDVFGDWVLVDGKTKLKYPFYESETHEHEFATEWSTDETAHWYVCTAEDCDITDYASCGIEGAAYAAHTWSNGTCTVCGYVCKHNYVENICSLCGRERKNTYSLTLGGKIGTNIYLDLDSYTAENIVVKINYNKSNTAYETNYTTETFSKSNFTNVNGRYLYTVWQAPAQIAENIKVEIYDGETLLDTISVNGMTYATAIMDGNYDPNLKALVKAMVLYADDVANHFDYANVSNQPDYKVITEDKFGSVADVTITDPGFTASVPAGVKLTGVTFMALQDSAVRIYYTGTVGEVSSDKFSVRKGINGINTYIEVYGIEAANLDEVFTVSIDGVEAITGSALSYVKTALNSSNTGLVNVAKAIAYYNAMADVYYGA